MFEDWDTALDEDAFELDAPAELTWFDTAPTEFDPAVNNLLNIDYVDIAKEATQDPKYILLFFYYGGMIFTALKVRKILGFSTLWIKWTLYFHLDLILSNPLI